MKYFILLLPFLCITSIYAKHDNQEKIDPKFTAQEVFYAWLAQRYLSEEDQEILQNKCNTDQLFELVATGKIKEKPSECIAVIIDIINKQNKNPIFAGPLQQEILKTSNDGVLAETNRLFQSVEPENFSFDQVKTICGEEYRYYNAGLEDYLAKRQGRPQRAIEKYKKLKEEFLWNCSRNNRPIDSLWLRKRNSKPAHILMNNECRKVLDHIINNHKLFKKENELDIPVVHQ